MAAAAPFDDPSAWRQKGYLYRDVPAAVQTHVRIQTQMSPLIRGLYLPHQKLSVVNLAKFILPPMAFTPTEYKIPTNHSFFSKDANHSDLESLTQITVPPPTLIGQLISEVRQRYLEGMESIHIPWTNQLFPLWVLDLWGEFHRNVAPNVTAWAKGIEWLLELTPLHPREVKITMHALTTLAWTGNIPAEDTTGLGLPRSLGDPIESLAIYLSRNWFASRQIDQMLDLILYDIKKAVPTRQIRGMTTAITTEILVQYRKSLRDYDPKMEHFLQRFGRSLQDGVEFTGLFHVHNNHWVCYIHATSPVFSSTFR
ncbi:hypothetical protein DFH07DRAFT_969455 [Mycena maculata]|uniref:Uncharacterized protein n=1 Tax=Mycena maculata TaxID=230809 RepID=A0AAD7HW61_9AGAR|nr:hypothetical protein DFH07DRAFT_969455 [Mycena maculata]